MHRFRHWSVSSVRGLAALAALSAAAAAPLLLGGCPTTTTPDPQPTNAPRDPIPAAPAAGTTDPIPNNTAATNPRVQTTNMTYFIQNFSAQLSEERQVQLIADAFARWSAVTPLNFTRVNADAGADFVIGFGRTTHCELYAPRNLGCPPQPFEATTLGHAYFPGTAERGQCHMNEAFNYSDERLLFSTLVHELGHNLGLDHIPPTDAVMFADDNGQTGNLTQADIDAVQRLYGSRDGSVRPTAPPAPPAGDGGASRTAPTTSLPDTDGDGLDDASERYVLGTNYTNGDSDGDGLGDGVEAVAGLDAKDGDTDGDGVSDGVELDGTGNAFRPDFASTGDVSALLGKYVGTDSNGSTLEFTIASDGTIGGKLSITLYGFAEDVELLGAADSTGKVELVSYDFFFEYEGTISGQSASGTLSTDTDGEGTWTATRGAPRLQSAGRGDFGLYRAKR